MYIHENYTVEEARQWYEINKKSDLTLKSGDIQENIINVKPDWSSSVEINDSHFKTIETPLFAQGSFGFSTEENYDTFLQTDDSRYKSSITRLIVRHDAEVDSTIGFLMTIIPSRDYRKKRNFKAFSSNYKKWEKAFSGYILYHNLDGSYANGWEFNNGEVILSVKQKKPSDFDVTLKSTACKDIYLIEWWQDCTDWYKPNSYTGIYEYTNTTCGDPYEVGEYSYTACGGVSPDDPVSSGGGYSPNDPNQESCGCYVCTKCGGCLGANLLKSISVNCPPCDCPDVLTTNDFEQYPCLENILVVLTNSTKVSARGLTIDPNLTASILELFDMSTRANLYLDVKCLGDSDVNGRAAQGANANAYQITLNSTYIETATDLSIARTFIHEIIHSSLLYQVNEREGADFDELYAIWNSMSDDPNRPKEYQHEFMTGIHDIIADNLYEWCRQSNTYIDMSYCSDLAWGGLENTSTYQALSSTDKNRIHNRLINEKINNSYAKGKDCN